MQIDPFMLAVIVVCAICFGYVVGSAPSKRPPSEATEEPWLEP